MVKTNNIRVDPLFKQWTDKQRELIKNKCGIDVSYSQITKMIENQIKSLNFEFKLENLNKKRNEIILRGKINHNGRIKEK